MGGDKNGGVRDRYKSAGKEDIEQCRKLALWDDDVSMLCSARQAAPMQM